MARQERVSRGVVFDFDGTLIDSYTFRDLAHVEVSRILLKYIAEKGLAVNRKKMLSFISQIETEMTVARTYDRKAWFAKVLERYIGDGEISPEVLSKATNAYWNTVIKHSSVYPCAKELLASLRQKKMRLGLVSDTDGVEGMKSRRIALSTLRGFLGAQVISGEDTKEVKPHRAPFIRICELLRVSPRHCLYVGDDPRVDVAGAKQIGMKTIIVKNPGANFEDTGSDPDVIVERVRFCEIEQLISRLLEKD